MIRPLALLALAWTGTSVLACAVWAVVAPRLLHDEDEVGEWLCIHCDEPRSPSSSDSHVCKPDDLMDLAEAFGVAVPVPLVRKIAQTPEIRDMKISESATDRDIDDLPVIGGTP